jgi:urea transport system ATP-binding protein
MKAKRGPFATLFAKTNSEEQDRIDAMLKLVGVSDRRAELAGALSHGQKQWLEIGMLMMQEPSLLLVDEPVAGMTDAETEQTAHLLREINKTKSLMVVEHDMTFVEALGVKVTVLHEGSVLAEGPLDFVRNDQQVIDVYLGR